MRFRSSLRLKVRNAMITLDLYRRSPQVHVVLLLVLCLLCLCTKAHSAPLPDAAQRAFAAMTADPEPTELIRSSHYWVSNENAHDVYRPHIENSGGILLGVGTDQLYLLAGWARPEVLIPMDFDGMISQLHYIYGAAFLSSPDIATFLSFWEPDAETKMRAAVAEHFGPRRAEAAMSAWSQGGQRVLRRFRRMELRYQELRIPTFVTDEATYQSLRQLWLDGRVFPLRGDVTGERAMTSIAKAAKEAELPVRAIYLSNVEQYVEYTPAFRRNFIDLPMDQRSWVLRTRPMRSLGLADEHCDYHYNLQRGQNFQRWLAANTVPDGRSLLLRNLEQTKRAGLSEIRREAPVSTTPPVIAPTPR